MCGLCAFPPLLDSSVHVCVSLTTGREGEEVNVCISIEGEVHTAPKPNI